MKWIAFAVLLGCQQGSGPSPAPDLVAAAPVLSRPTPPLDVPAPADPVIAIGRGDQHACVVHASGTVDCWGQPKWCRQCDAPMPPDSRVRRLEGLSDAVAISAHGRCFVRKTGEVTCIDPTTGALAPLEGAKHARATTENGCVLLSTGDVWCNNDWRVEHITDIRDATAIAAGGRLTCVIRKAGTLACQSEGSSFARVAGIDHVRALAIAYEFDQGSPLICVLAATPRCFHVDDTIDGAVISPSTSDYDVPQLDPGQFAAATQIAISKHDGDSEVDALVDSRVVITDAQGTRMVPVLADARLLTSGCAVRATGAVACWGRNDGGVLAQPTTVGRMDVPASPVPGVANIASVVAGYTQTWVVSRDGRVMHWGARHRERELTPTEVRFTTGGFGEAESIVELLASGRSVCARSRFGHVWCELDQYGEHVINKLAVSGVTGMSELYDLELRHADGRIDRVDAPYGMSAPEPARNPSPAIQSTQLDAGICDRFADGHVTCNRKPMPELAGATTIATGGAVGCAIVAKRVSCWAEGSPAQPIASLTAATDLKMGYDYACAVDGGRVMCWHFAGGKPLPPVQMIASGAESIGLGLGTSYQYREAFTVLDGPSPAGEYGCAVMVDHTVQCWGANLYGELLDNSLLSSVSPIGIRL